MSGMYSLQPKGLRWSVVADEALLEATEVFLVEAFQLAMRCASHFKRYVAFHRSYVPIALSHVMALYYIMAVFDEAFT